jgi:phospholipid-binding lipoprotein MlaA
MNKHINKIILSIALLGLMSGCATTQNNDPLEGINRGVYKFNDVADRYVMKPVATTYKNVAPTPIRKGVSNFFGNLLTITTVVNDLLQLKFSQAFNDAGRFVINSTFGIAGLIDVASMDNIPKHQEDFGQTLGYWGVGNGPYLVWPIYGSSTLRDTTGFVFDSYTSDPITYIHRAGNVKAHNQVRLVQLLNRRYELLDASDLVDSASLDPYAFARDSYLQHRASLVQDGGVTNGGSKDVDGFEPAEDDKPNTEQVPAPESK